MEAQFSPSWSKTFTRLKIRQIEAATDPTRRDQIARAFVKAKIENSQHTLEELGIRKRLREPEFSAAERYWRILKPLLNANGLRFHGRGRGKTRMRATDQVNASLNYGYSILEGVCRKVLIAEGFLTEIGFIHRIKMSGSPLVYDFMELGRADVDLGLIRLIKEKKLRDKDFARAYDLTCYCLPEAKEKLKTLDFPEDRIRKAAERLSRFLLKGGSFEGFEI